MSKAFRKFVEQKAAQRVANRRRSIQMTIEQLAEEIRNQSDKLAKLEEDTRKEAEAWAESILLLRKHRIRHEANEWAMTVTVRTTKKRLGKIRQAIGRLDPQTLGKSPYDVDRGLILVSLRSAKYPVRVEYLHKLKPTDKCRLVEYKTLVCER